MEPGNDVKEFFRVLEENKIKPTFWMSEEYFEKAKFKVKAGAQGMSVRDEFGILVFPLILYSGKIVDCACWSSFVGNVFPKYSAVFVDYEFIYNPKDFKDMSGGRWSAYRKNVNRFKKRNPIVFYEHRQSYFYKNQQQKIVNIFVDWLLSKEKEFIIEDDEVILEYIVRGENQKILWNDKAEIIGVNIWDENYKYINFRYSFCDKRQAYLSEYLRYLFYTDPEIVNKNKLVNDGGVLGFPSLYKFKNKMNPMEINTINGWEMKNG